MLVLPGMVAAAPIPYVYPFNMMTAEEVIAKLLKDPSSELDVIKREITDAYVNGIKDATHGSVWCLAHPILPHELNSELAFAIRTSRRPDELKRNAAPLLLDELRKRYPCKTSKGGGK